MTFADMVLARDLLNFLDDVQIMLLLDALDGECVQFGLHDRLAVAAFANELQCVFGAEHPLAHAIDEALAGRTPLQWLPKGGALRA